MKRAKREPSRAPGAELADGRPAIRGVKHATSIPLLLHHDNRLPLGTVKLHRATDDGIAFTARIPKIDEPGTLKDRLDEAWQSMKAKLVGGLSIGFKPLEYSRIEDTYSYRYMKWLWLELSAVTVPANGDCSITAIKSADEAIRRAASGAKAGGRVVRLDTVAKAADPGASGNQKARRSGVVYLN